MKTVPVEIQHLYISPGHNFYGHHGQAAGEHPTRDVAGITCVAGRGVEGDRFFDYKPDFKGQITFFDAAVYRRLARELGRSPIEPSASRRNVILEGIDLNELIGRCFSLGGIRFQGIEECRPCLWMDEAIGEGAEERLTGWGGLRAQILEDGELVTGSAELVVE